jgi:hypothetical protein
VPFRFSVAGPTIDADEWSARTSLTVFVRCQEDSFVVAKRRDSVTLPAITEAMT